MQALTKQELIERMLDKTSFTPDSAVYQSMMKHLMRLSEQDIYILASQVAEVTFYRQA